MTWTSKKVLIIFHGITVSNLTPIDKVFLTGKDVIVDPSYVPETEEELDQDLYYYYYHPKDLKLAEKEFKKWLR